MKSMYGLVCVVPEATYPFRFCGQVVANPDLSHTVYTYPLHKKTLLEQRPELMNDESFNKDCAIRLNQPQWIKAREAATNKCVYPTPAGLVITRLKFENEDVSLEVVLDNHITQRVLYTTTFDVNGDEVNMYLKRTDGYGFPFQGFDLR